MDLIGMVIVIGLLCVCGSFGGFWGVIAGIVLLWVAVK